MVKQYLYDDCIPEGSTFCQTSEAISKYVPPFILALGTLGNISTCAVLMRKKFRNETSSIFLMFLAAFDCIYLWLVVIPSALGISMGKCGPIPRDVYKIVASIEVSTQAMSLYTIAMIAMERVVCICYPFRVNSIITKNRCIILVLGVMICIVSVHMSATFVTEQYIDSKINSTTSTCVDSMEENDAKYMIIVLVKVLVQFAIPITVTVIGNAIIIRRMFTRGAAMASLTLSSSSMALRNSVTKIVVAITVFYILTTMPFFAFLIYNTLFGVDSNNQTATKMYLVQNVLFQFMLMNHACTFVLYVWTGSAFRAECRQMLGDIKKFVFLLCRAGEVP